MNVFTILGYTRIYIHSDMHERNKYIFWYHFFKIGGVIVVTDITNILISALEVLENSFICLMLVN